MNLLCLSSLGLREPLVHTRVLSYLRQLMQDGIQVTLLTFEPEFKRSWAPTTAAEWRERLEGEGIRWRSRPYHKRPSLRATVYDILVGAWVASRLVRRERIDIRALEEVDALRASDGPADRCRASELARFDLEGTGGARYRRLYQRLFRENLPESRSAVAAL